MNIDNNRILDKLNKNNLHLHEIDGRIDSDVLKNYDDNHKINHMYSGDESHFVMNNDGIIVFIGNCHCLQGFLNSNF